MQKIKMFLNKVQIIGAILSTIMIIIIPILKNNKFVSIGWFFIGLTSFGDALFTKNGQLLEEHGRLKTIKILKSNYQKSIVIRYLLQ